MGFEIVSPGGAPWTSLFERLDAKNKDVFFNPEFAAACAETIYSGKVVRCALLSRGPDFLLYPFVERQINAPSGEAFHDVVGLYGLGGIATTTADPSLASEFYGALDSHFAQTGAICRFDRFHPVIQNNLLASPLTVVVEKGTFVVVDLQKPILEVEKAYRHDQRKSIKKAERNGVQVFHENTAAHLDDFLSIYHSTLDRRAAHAFYYFPRSFYDELAARLPDQIKFFYAEHNSRIISCELVLFDGPYAHSYLGGTYFDCKELCANSLLKRDIIRFSHARGCHKFLLGGGPTASDGIARYKFGFSPTGGVPFFVGETMYDRTAYDRLKHLVTASGVMIEPGRFLFYDPMFTWRPYGLSAPATHVSV